MMIIAIKTRLQKLLDNIQKKEDIQKRIADVTTELLREKNRPLDKVNAYDAIHKLNYISKRIGDKPQPPSKAMAIVIPVYRKRKKEYEVALAEYNERFITAQKEYYQEHETERTALAEKDRQEKIERIDYLNSVLSELKETLSVLEKEIEEEDIVGKVLKNAVDIQSLYDIFDNKRAETIKEGVNVLVEDKHRRRMEELQEEQVRLTREACEAAKQAEESADEAISIAEQALAKAEKAYDRADEAYDRANEAYSEAQDAYSEARNAYNQATSH